MIRSSRQAYDHGGALYPGGLRLVATLKTLHAGLLVAIMTKDRQHNYRSYFCCDAGQALRGQLVCRLDALDLERYNANDGVPVVQEFFGQVGKKFAGKALRREIRMHRGHLLVIHCPAIYVAWTISHTSTYPAKQPGPIIQNLGDKRRSCKV